MFKVVSIFICSVIIMYTILFMSAKAIENQKEYYFTEEESLLLQQIAIAEAGNQGIGGMAFVIQTILNRVEDENFPNTIEEVISQKKQFTTYAEGKYKDLKPTENSQKAIELLSILQNRGQLYFENDLGKESTWHSRNLEFIFEYGDHKFYK